MTQAVLNNTNILQENSFFKQNNEVNDCMQSGSFSSIIDTKMNDKNATYINDNEELNATDVSIQESDIQPSQSLIEDIKEFVEDAANVVVEDFAENLNTTLVIPNLEISETTKSLSDLIVSQNLEEAEAITSDMVEVQEDILNNEIQTDEVINLITENDSDIKAEKPINTSKIELKDEIVKELKIESIEAETDTAANDEGMMNDTQTPQEHALKAMISNDSQVFDINSIKVNTQQNQVQNMKSDVQATEINQNKIIEQITKHFDNLQSNSKVNIVLNPESLGKVSVHLVKSAEGLSAQFMVSTEEARDILMKGLDGLKENLLSNGVGVDNVSVKLNNTQESEYQSDWTEQENSQSGAKEQHPQNREKQKGLFEKIATDILENENNEG